MAEVKCQELYVKEGHILFSVDKNTSTGKQYLHNER